MKIQNGLLQPEQHDHFHDHSVPLTGTEFERRRHAEAVSVSLGLLTGIVTVSGITALIWLFL
jgi:hypothetical protein